MEGNNHMKTKKIFQTNRQKSLIAMVVAFFATMGATTAFAAIPVVATVPELADITRQVGGDNVTVYSVAKPNTDYHTVEARPSDVQRVARAKMIVTSGMALELWMNSLLNAAGNNALNRGGAGYVDASAGIRRMEVPTSQITGASGDIHADGNPHYWYDPVYGKFIARNIVKGLIRVDPAHAAEYRANYTKFNAELDRRMAGWTSELAPYRGQPVVTYHKDYIYFLRRFGLREYGNLEPKPGIPPSASHVNALIQGMKRDHVKAVVIESIFPTRFGDLITRQTGAKYVVAPYSVGSLGTKNYFQMIDLLVDRFKQALSQ
jgi:zinc/manganese transport system substrate-binding protein